MIWTGTIAKEWGRVGASGLWLRDRIGVVRVVKGFYNFEGLKLL